MAGVHPALKMKMTRLARGGKWKKHDSQVIEIEWVSLAMRQLTSIFPYGNGAVSGSRPQVGEAGFRSVEIRAWIHADSPQFAARKSTLCDVWYHGQRSTLHR